MKTPLEIENQEGPFGDCCSTFDAAGFLICDNEAYYPHPVAPEHQERIVACVNACAGMDNPEALRAQLIEYFEADAAAVAELKAIFPEWVNPEAEDRHERTRKLLNLP